MNWEDAIKTGKKIRPKTPYHTVEHWIALEEGPVWEAHDWEVEPDIMPKNEPSEFAKSLKLLHCIDGTKFSK